MAMVWILVFSACWEPLLTDPRGSRISGIITYSPWWREYLPFLFPQLQRWMVNVTHLESLRHYSVFKISFLHLSNVEHHGMLVCLLIALYMINCAPLLISWFYRKWFFLLRSLFCCCWGDCYVSWLSHNEHWERLVLHERSTQRTEI